MCFRELRQSGVGVIDKVGECFAVTPNVSLAIGKLEVATPSTLKATVLHALPILLRAMIIEFLLDGQDAASQAFVYHLIRHLQEGHRNKRREQFVKWGCESFRRPRRFGGVGGIIVVHTFM